MKGFIEVTVLEPIDVSTYEDAYEEIRTLINARAIIKCVKSKKQPEHCLVQVGEPFEVIFVKESYTEVRAKIMEAML